MPVHCVDGTGFLQPAVGGRADDDVFYLRLRQCGYGQWPSAGGGRAATVGQLWWNVRGNADGGVWGVDVGSYP